MSEIKERAGLESVDGCLPGWQTRLLAMSLRDLPSVGVHFLCSTASFNFNDFLKHSLQIHHFTRGDTI